MDMFDTNKVFSVLDSYGMNTLAFQVNATTEEGQTVLSIEKMKSFVEQEKNGFKKTFFFNPDPEPDEGKSIVFLTITPRVAILYGGEFFNGRLIVGVEFVALIYFPP